MIILIDGTSCSGKTKLAYELIKKYHYPCFSLDHLKMGLIRGLKDCPIQASDSDDAISEYLFPMVKGIIETNIENKQNLILEGCYLPCAKIKALTLKYPNEIIPIYMVFSKNYILSHFQDVLKYRKVVEDRGYEEDRSIEDLISEHQIVKNACIENALPYFEADTSYEEMLFEIKQFLCNRIGF